MLGLGDFGATQAPPPPPLAGSALKAAGAVSMSSLGEGYGPAAALSACSLPGLRARGGLVIHQIGETRIGTASFIRRKESDGALNPIPSAKHLELEAPSFPYLKGRRPAAAIHAKPREPPDRGHSTSRSPLQTSLTAMMYPALSPASVPETAKVNPEVGGGEKGAPIADAARPKPSTGETAAMPAASRNARAILVGTQGDEKATGVADDAHVVCLGVQINQVAQGKRQASDFSAAEWKDTQGAAMVLHTNANKEGRRIEGTPKKLKLKGTSDADAVPMVSEEMGSNNMEATGSGAAGKLTGSQETPRQEQ